MMSDQHSESKSYGCNSNGNNNNNNNNNNNSNSNSSNGNTTTAVTSISNVDSILLFYLPVDEIVEDREYSTLIPPITKAEYESLKEDISANGIRVPLIINSNHILLDGYTRLRIAKELGLKSVPCIVRNKKEEEEEEEGGRDVSLSSSSSSSLSLSPYERLEEELFIISINANRRHLNTAQKVELALKVMEIEQEKARLRSLANLRQYQYRDKEIHPTSKTNINQIDQNQYIDVYSPTGVLNSTRRDKVTIGVRERLANILKISNKTIDKGKKIKEVALKNQKVAEYWLEALQGKRSIRSVYDKVKEVEAREKIRPIVEEAKERLGNSLGLIPATSSLASSPNLIPATVTSHITLLYGDFRDVLKDIPDNSIDLIFTDPPYSREYLPLIIDLALLASRILKPSGFLAIMYGQDHLDKFFIEVSNINLLRYYWTIALHMPESSEILATKNVEICWKPIIVYQKEPMIRRARRFKDHISALKPDKDMHKWRQDIGSAIHVIKSLTEDDEGGGEGSIVLDPLAGTGVTVEACLMLKRRCIAVEKDKDMYELLRRRFAQQ